MWRFVQLSDPHLASDYDGEWNSRVICSMMPDVMACLAKDLAALAPEFILATGDIASQQTREAMLEAARQMDSLGIPYYPMGGNHDFVYEDSRAWFLEAFGAHLPESRTYYAFEHKGLRFVVLDAWWLWTDGTLSPISQASVAAHLDITPGDARWAVPPEQLRWLREDLSAHRGAPTIVCCHYPAIPVPGRLRRPEFNDTGALHNGELLLDLLRGYPQVKAMVSGHNHMNFVEHRKGVFHIVTSALPEYPVEYRVFEVHGDRIEVRSQGLSDGSFAERSLIPGTEWLRGEQGDRETVIPL